MTLLELLLTMALIGVVLGAGLGVFATLDFARRAALGLVQNVIRAARNTAVARGAPARVRLDREARTITAEAMSVIGTWHFERESLAGAFDLDGRMGGAVLIEDGYLGRALSLALSRGATARFDVERVPSYDPREGFSLDCALRLESADSGRILNLGGVVGLSLEESGALRAWLIPEVVGSTGEARAGGRIFVDAPAGALQVGAWRRVRFEYDRRVARLFVDGVELARTDESLPVWRLQGPLVLGDAQASFAGALDALVIAAVSAGETAALPDSVAFGPDAPGELRFDARGHLDREVHAQPVQFGLTFDDGTSAAVNVGLYGTVH
jgi:hypothetical protein